MAKKVAIERLDPDREQLRLNKILALQRQNDIIQLLLEGKEKSEIVQYIVGKYMVTPLTANNFISEANKIIKERSAYEVNNLISLHIHRYETIYALLYETKSYGMAMTALRQKEKLMGFHKEGFHMRVQSGTISAIQLQTVTGEYDVMKLSKDRQSRMTFLLEKSKRQDNDNAVAVQKVRERQKNARLKHFK